MNHEGYKIGDKFEVIDPVSNHYHKKGDILELVGDKDFWAPEFKTLTPDNRYGQIHASTMDKLRPLEKIMDINEAYRVMQANCGIEEGDTVKILRGWNYDELGCPIEMNEAIDAIGLEGVVININDRRVEVEFNDLGCNYVFPYFVLEKVKSGVKSIYLNEDKEYKAEFLSNGKVKVGCQEIDFETIEKIYNTARSTRD